jgi:uncharacterized protein (TIGR02284 family)
MATNVVSVLNDLVETSKDGEKGFLKAAEDAHDAQLKTLFQSRAVDCARGARELQDAVQGMGGKPETHGSVSGALHRGWVDVKSAVANRSDHENARRARTSRRSAITMRSRRNCRRTCAQSSSASIRACCKTMTACAICVISTLRPSLNRRGGVIGCDTPP